MADYPGNFLPTVIRKPLYIFGQDIKNLYFVFERGQAGTAEQYSVAYWIAGGFYLAIILLIVPFVMRKSYTRDTSPALILPWAFVLYPIFAHSLFEAAERHHYAAL